MKRNKKNGFTIIELVITISIIMILMSLAIPMAGNAKVKARQAKAKAEVAALETALSAYYGDMGTYPTDSPTATHESDNSVIIKHLSGRTDGTGAYDTTITNNADWNGPYMEFDSDDIKNGKFVDPWGNAYQIDVALDSVINDGNPPTNNAFSFDIKSTGSPNDADDDVTNY